MSCTILLGQISIYFILVLGSSLSQPLNNTTVSDQECTTNDGCLDGNICVDLKCVNPCQGLCGSNTICVVQDLLPICSCKTGYDGDPFTECKPRADIEFGTCYSNSQCPIDKACIDQQCLDPCQGICGFNSVCRVVNHHPICACLKGFVFSPNAGCKPVLIPECVNNIHCPEDRACRQQKCVDPCEAGVCGNNTLCHVKNHYPVCMCKVGFLGDALHECVPFCSIQNGKRDNKTFIFGDGMMSWFNAFDYCKDRGMNLATINSENEWNELGRVITPDQYGAVGFWIGGHDMGRFNKFIWISTGNRLSFTRWEVNEPRGEQYHCLKVNKDKKWLSHDCSNTYYFVCESIKSIDTNFESL